MWKIGIGILEDEKKKGVAFLNEFTMSFFVYVLVFKNYIA